MLLMSGRAAPSRGLRQPGVKVNLARRGPLLIGAAVLLPLIILAAVQIAFSAREQRRQTEAEAVAAASILMVQSDARMSRTLGALDALATVPSFTDGNLQRAYARTRDIQRLNPDWVSVRFVEAGSGLELFDLRRPFGPPRRDPATSRSLPPSLLTRSAAGDMGGSGPGCPCIQAHRLIRGPEGQVYALTALVDPGPTQKLALAAGGPQRIVAIADRRGNFVARSTGFAEKVGTPGSTYLRKAVARGGDSGIYSGTTLEGFVNYTGFARSRLSGWSAHIAFEPNLLDAPRKRSLAAAGFAVLAALALACFLIWITIRQLAEGRRVEERLQEAQKLEALGQLTGGIAHDFNNLLTPILGGLDLLARKDSLDDRSRRIAEGALTSARKAAKLTAQLLAFSRRQRLEMRPVDLKALMTEVEPLLRQSVGAEVMIEIDVDEEARCVLSDSNQLELALLNLVVNARDAMPGGGSIRIAAVPWPGAADEGAKVRLTVSDTGEGMSSETVRRATEPFFTTKPAGSGTGLGLAQVYGIVHQSGGAITIESEVGKGTIVTIELPGCVLPPKSAADSADPSVAGRSADFRVLVCDDDDSVRGFVARTLEEAGYAVEAVADGRTAIEAIRNGGHDMLVVDFAMHGLNGAEVARQVLGFEPAPAVLMITGYADTELLEKMGEDVPILRKPFDGPALLAAIRRSLDGRERKAEA